MAMVFCSSLFAIWISGERIKTLNEISILEQQKREIERTIQTLNAKTIDVKKAVPVTVLSDEQKMQLASARQLIAKRNFSWNQLFSDIEHFVPKDAFVLSIKVDDGSKLKINPEESNPSAILEIKAAGKSSSQMTEMMTALEHSGGLFEIEQASQETTTDEGLVPFTLRLTYKPRGSESGGQQ
ncbi:MAG: hypothetical protein AB1757_19425 [Acidobacteriota bacterium]